MVWMNKNDTLSVYLYQMQKPIIASRITFNMALPFKLSLIHNRLFILSFLKSFPLRPLYSIRSSLAVNIDSQHSSSSSTSSLKFLITFFNLFLSSEVLPSSLLHSKYHFHLSIEAFSTSSSFERTLILSTSSLLQLSSTFNPTYHHSRTFSLFLHSNTDFFSCSILLSYLTTFPSKPKKWTKNSSLHSSPPVQVPLSHFSDLYFIHLKLSHFQSSQFLFFNLNLT